MMFDLGMKRVAVAALGLGGQGLFWWGSTIVTPRPSAAGIVFCSGNLGSCVFEKLLFRAEQ